MNDKILKNYQKCLYEIKHRLNVLEDHFTEKNVEKYQIVEIEIICLQFRKILENIIFASLCANLDEYKKIRKSYMTDWNISGIIKSLEKTNKDFFPKPISNKKVDFNGKNLIEIEDRIDNSLTKEELIDAYGKLSDYLHATNPFYNLNENMEDIARFFLKLFVKIKLLLVHHSIVIDYNMIIGILDDQKDVPEVYWFKNIG